MNHNSKNAYASPNSMLASMDVNVRYAGLWVRLLASIVDSLWQMPLVFALGFLVYGREYFESDAMFKGPIDAVIQIAFPMILIVGFWFYRSATPGKMAFNIIIVNKTDLCPATKSQLVTRYVAYYVSLLSLGLGFLWVGIDKEKQGFHDKIAKTVVVYR